MKKITAQEMSRLSWEARKKKYGEEGARKILVDASKKGVEARKLKVKCECHESEHPT